MFAAERKIPRKQLNAACTHANIEQLGHGKSSTFEMQDRNLEHLSHEIDDTKVQIISHHIRSDGCITLQHSGLPHCSCHCLDTAGGTALPAKPFGGQQSL